jgi:hypothetical protein
VSELKMHWDWVRNLCIPPFTLHIRKHIDNSGEQAYSATIKCGVKGFNALYTTGDLPPDTTWEELGATMLTLVEMKYSQQEINEGVSK